MCLAIPGQITAIDDRGPFDRIGRVRFGGIQKDVNLAYVPEARVGDYAIVHVGFAIGLLDEAEALKTLEYVSQLEAEEPDDGFSGDSGTAGAA